MFSKFFSKQKLNIYAPLSGDVISLDEVPDPVFGCIFGRNDYAVTGYSFLASRNRRHQEFTALT